MHVCVRLLWSGVLHAAKEREREKGRKEDKPPAAWRLSKFGSYWREGERRRRA